jgi:hypothetical protein
MTDNNHNFNAFTPDGYLYESTVQPHLFSAELSHSASISSPIADSYNNIDFYKTLIHGLFGMYLDGEITLEEFVQRKNWPEVCARDAVIEGRLKERSLAQMPKVKEVEENDQNTELGAKVAEIGNKKNKSKTFHKENVQKILEKFKKDGKLRPMGSRLDEPKRKEVLGRIAKLRRFMHEKMMDRKKRFLSESSIDSYKIYEIIMNIANEALSRLDNKNMVDSFNFDNFAVKYQQSPVYLSDCNIRSKSYMIKSKQTYSQRKAEQTHLKRFLRDMDNKSSTHAQMVVSVFDQTVDRYYKHIRPPTPVRLVEKMQMLEKIKEEIRKKEAEVAGESPIKVEIMQTAHKEDEECESPGLSVSKRDQKINEARKGRFSFFRLDTRNLEQLTNNIGDRLSSPVKSPNPSLKPIPSTDRSKKQPQLFSITKSTFSSKMKSATDTRDVEEYKFCKQRQLLEYLKLDGRAHKEHRGVLDNKIKVLESVHEQIDDDRNNLKKKIEFFDPLNIEDLKYYLDTTENYSVD